MTLPNFLIIGAGKSGTTSLYEYLKQHPQVYMSPIKETNYFAYENGIEHLLDNKIAFVKTLDEYATLFRDATIEKAIGEASPRYMWCSRTAARIKEQLPAAKLIAILRNPVDRAYSAFNMKVGNGTETRSFGEALRAEQEASAENRVRGETRYIENGRYNKLLQPYFELFPREQIAVHLFDDLAANPNAVMQRIFQFLNVDDTFVPQLRTRHNPSGSPPVAALNVLFRKTRFTKILRRSLPPVVSTFLMDKQAELKGRLLKTQVLDCELRALLHEKFRNDIVALQATLQRDLSHWLADHSTDYEGR